MEKQKSNKIKLKIAKISIEFRFLFFLTFAYDFFGGSRDVAAAPAVGVPRLLGRFFLRTITRMVHN